MNYQVKENIRYKNVISDYYNYGFDKKTGYFGRWGKTEADDPVMAPANEILDIEITDICKGPGNIPCPFCSPVGSLVNTPNGNVPIEKLKKGNFVLGYNIDTNTRQIQKIIETYHRNYEGVLIVIELEDGSTLKLTPEHVVILTNGIEKMAKDLTEKDNFIYF